MNNITLGRYAPYDSFIHRMDPRNKVICLILLIVAIFFQFTYPDKTTNWIMTFIMGGILLVFIFILLIVSHVGIRQMFSSLKSLWFIVIFLMVINAIIPPRNATMIAFSIKNFHVYWEAIFQSLKIILRLVLMLSLTMILTATTKPLDLTYALEWFMTPLKIIRFPAHEIAMTISIALRFIPTLLDETQRIMRAQESRGVDFRKGRIGARFKAIVSLIVPLFVSAFQRSEELADAMEARGYDPRAKRTKYRKLHFHFGDIFAFLLVGAIMSGVIIVSHFHFDISTVHFVPILSLVGCGVLLYLVILGAMNANIRRFL